MDNTIILYLIKASIALALFYGLYMLFLKKDTFFKVRRFYFLFAILFSLVFPLFVIEIPIQQEVDTVAPVYAYWLSQIEIGEVVVEEAPETTVTVWFVVGLVVAIISFILAFRFLTQLLSLVKLRVDSESHKIASYRIVKLENKKVSPFSFFSWIFINVESQESQDLEEIIAHEQVHVRQFHSVDVILSEILCICFWWNPFVWLLRNEMKINLEYLADQGVLKAGFNIKEYQYVLLQVSNKNTGIPLINNFNVSQLKKRITMMNKKRTPLSKATKYLLAIPLGTALLLGNAVQASPELKNFIASEGQATENNIIVIEEMESAGIVAASNNIIVAEKTDVAGLVNDTVPKKPFTTVEQMPSFPGGENAMNKYIGDNLKYPVKAQEAGVEGRVTIRFVIGETGKISDVTVVRGLSPECDEEAVRVIKAMPDWTPGKQKGKNVPVYFTLPIVFKLHNDSAEKKKEAVPGSTKTVAVQRIDKGASGSGKQSAFYTVEQMPSFPGGANAMNKYIGENLKYPVKAQEAGIEGRVTVRFVVGETGKISDVTVVRGLSPECDEEAARVIRAMPDWEPGKQNGQNVDVYFTLPLVFKLKRSAEEEKSK